MCKGLLYTEMSIQNIIMNIIDLLKFTFIKKTYDHVSYYSLDKPTYFVSVSYTHLDVYKRQANDILPSLLNFQSSAVFCGSNIFLIIRLSNISSLFKLTCFFVNIP